MNESEQSYSEAALLTAVDDLLQIEENCGLWDVPGEYWDDGEGYIAANEARTSPELQSVIARLRVQRRLLKKSAESAFRRSFIELGNKQ